MPSSSAELAGALRVSSRWLLRAHSGSVEYARRQRFFLFSYQKRNLHSRTA